MKKLILCILFIALAPSASFAQQNDLMQQVLKDYYSKQLGQPVQPVVPIYPSRDAGIETLRENRRHELSDRFHDASKRYGVTSPEAIGEFMHGFIEMRDMEYRQKLDRYNRQQEYHQRKMMEQFYQK